MKKNMITNERFYIHPGEITKNEHPEDIKHKAKTYYDYFDEDGNPKEGREDKKHDQV